MNSIDAIEEIDRIINYSERPRTFEEAEKQLVEIRQVLNILHCYQDEHEDYNI